MSTEESKNQERLTHHGEASEEVDPRRINETTQAILSAVESASPKFWEASVHAQPRNRVARLMVFVASTWIIFFALLSAGTLAIGYFAYEVVPWHSIKRIGDEQKLYEQENRLHQQQLKQNEFEQVQAERAREQAQAKQELASHHVGLGNSLLNVGRAEAAKAEFAKALEADPLSLEAQKGLSKSELFTTIENQDYDIGVVQQKLEALQKKYDGDPDTIEDDDSHLHAFLGDVFSHYAPREALREYKKAAAINPNNAHAISGISSILYQLGRIDKAVRKAEEAYSQANWDPMYQHNYASALYENQQYKEAKRQYKDVIKWDPAYMWSNLDLSICTRLMGNMYQAHWYGNRFIEMLDDESLTSLEENQGGAAVRTGPDSELVYLVEEPEKRYYAYLSLALTSYLMEKTSEAESYVAKAQTIQIDPFLKSEVKRLVNYDIDRLKQEQDFDTRADEFRAKYL